MSISRWVLGSCMVAALATGWFALDSASTRVAARPPTPECTADAAPSNEGEEPGRATSPKPASAIERLQAVLSDPTAEREALWNAYDAAALEHLNARGTLSEAELRSWLDSLSPHSAGFARFGVHADARRILIVWSDEVYLSGARATLFMRDAGERWTVADTHDLGLDGGYVSLAWRKGDALLVAGSQRTGDANWLTIVGLDVSGGIREALRLDLIDVGSVELPDGIRVETLVPPAAVGTHLFNHWREVQANVRWSPSGFTVTRTDLEPVVALLDDYCALRRDRDPAAGRLVRGGAALQRVLPSDCSRMTIEGVTYASPDHARIELTAGYRCAPGPTDTWWQDDPDEGLLGITDEVVLEARRTRAGWRLTGISSPDASCRPYRQVR